MSSLSTPSTGVLVEAVIICESTSGLSVEPPAYVLFAGGRFTSICSSASSRWVLPSSAVLNSICVQDGLTEARETVVVGE